MRKAWGAPKKAPPPPFCLRSRPIREEDGKGGVKGWRKVNSCTREGVLQVRAPSEGQKEKEGRKEGRKEGQKREKEKEISFGGLMC